MEIKRVTLFAGHYGSGKTNIAVNFALYLARQGKRAAIADLDIVNPYFRTKDSARELEEAGVDLISPQFANSNVDLPALPAEAYRLVEDRSLYAVMDIGGDDRGAYALGRYTPFLLEEGDYQMAFVANPCRPLTRTPEEALEVMREIEAAGGLPFTAIVNNANLAYETTERTVLEALPYMEELSRLSGLPIWMTTAEETVAALGVIRTAQGTYSGNAAARSITLSVAPKLLVVLGGGETCCVLLQGQRMGRTLMCTQATSGGGYPNYTAGLELQGNKLTAWMNASSSAIQCGAAPKAWNAAGTAYTYLALY